MNISRPTLLFLAALTALAGCAPTVSNDPKVNAKVNAKVNGGETAASDDSGKPDEDKAEPSVEVAVGSVLLEGDCPDPPVVDPSVPASIAPSAPAKRRKPKSPSVIAPGEAPPAGVASRRRRCQQSTLQLTFDNHGTAPVKVSVVEIRLRDVQTDKQVATLPSRMPSKWSEADNAYVNWDENLVATSSARTSYRIKPPSWSAVEAKLEGAASRGRTYDVEVSLEVNGAPTTARSAEFTRPPFIPMPPT